MKKLILNNEIFEAEKIIKTDKNIIGYDINNNEIFSFKGISDFTGFVLKDENDIVIEFEAPPLTEIEIANKRILNAENMLNAIMMM